MGRVQFRQRTCMMAAWTALKFLWTARVLWCTMRSVQCSHYQRGRRAAHKDGGRSGVFRAKHNTESPSWSAVVARALSRDVPAMPLHPER
eukprot:13172466-Alexandrium_andersonii.AAC.1